MLHRVKWIEIVPEGNFFPVKLSSASIHGGNSLCHSLFNSGSAATNSVCHSGLTAFCGRKEQNASSDFSYVSWDGGFEALALCAMNKVNTAKNLEIAAILDCRMLFNMMPP